jgi:hypothetical protein
MAHHFPAIRNSTGMALKIQLNAFVEKALDHHLMHGGLDEEFYISTLLHKAGLQSAIGLTLTQTAYNSLIRGITPLSYFLSRAKAERVRWKKKYGSQVETEHQAWLRAEIDALNVKFEGTPEQRQALAYWMEVLENPRAYYLRRLTTLVQPWPTSRA